MMRSHLKIRFQVPQQLRLVDARTTPGFQSISPLIRTSTCHFGNDSHDYDSEVTAAITAAIPRYRYLPPSKGEYNGKKSEIRLHFV